MFEHNPNISEDDIRTKVVYEWLKDCGLSRSNIAIEHSIRIKIGHGEKLINSRADVLVKNGSQNLLIVEVKAPKHQLTMEDRNQAVSYARSLAEGGIAPFTILTNGKKTLFFDSVTAEELTEISSLHPYIKNGLTPNGDSILARAEALEYLISFSKDNLMIFCRAQCESRMRLLKSDDIYSGKKYIPSLYTERSKTLIDLSSKLFEDYTANLVLIIGPPQHGKTCFICNTVEKFLAQDIPTLIYPAVSLRKGLIAEICADFEWFFGEVSVPRHIVGRLSRILESISSNMIVFVDGWNEMIDNAVAMNDECLRLNTPNIKLVISTTTSSLKHLLNDESGNSTYVATTAKLTASQIIKLSSEPLLNATNTQVVQIGKFDSNELIDAQEKHMDAFNVKFKVASHLPKDPFYLRLASEQFSNSEVPNFATRTSLIKESLLRKAYRRNISEINLYKGLHHLSEKIFFHGGAIPISLLPHELSDDINYNKWLESAILLSFHDSSGFPLIDFYYTHERDYCISSYRRWEVKIGKAFGLEFTNEIALASKTDAARSSLRWYLSCPENCRYIEKIYDNLTEFSNEEAVVIKQVLHTSILNQINFHGSLDFDWLERVIGKLTLNNDNDDELDEISNLVYLRIKGFNRDKDHINYKLWLKVLLSIDFSFENMGFEESYTNEIYQAHNHSLNDPIEDEESLEINLFIECIFSENEQLAENATIAVSYISPHFLLRKLPKLFKDALERLQSKAIERLENACSRILADKTEGYYGSMCPGWFDGVEKGNSEVLREFNEQQALWLPIYRLEHLSDSLRTDIKALLDDLKEHSTSDSDEHCEDKVEINYELFDPNQLKLDI